MQSLAAASGPCTSAGVMVAWSCPKSCRSSTHLWQSTSSPASFVLKASASEGSEAKRRAFDARRWTHTAVLRGPRRSKRSTARSTMGLSLAVCSYVSSSRVSPTEPALTDVTAITTGED